MALELATSEFETLLNEYADLYRRTRIARGYVDYNPAQVIIYAVEDMRNLLKHSGCPLEVLRDEVAFQKECLEKLASSLPSSADCK